MRHPFVWISSSFLLAFAIALTANLFSPTPVFKSVGNAVSHNVLGVNLFLIPNEDADSAAEVGLRAFFPEQSTVLAYGSQVEAGRFVLEAEGPFTLRYLSFEVKSLGLRPFEMWMVYPVEDGLVDFSQPVGVSERMEGGFLRLRFYSSPAQAYFAEPGRHEFALVTRILRDESSGLDPALHLAFAEPEGAAWQWAWLPGRHEEPWLDVTDFLGLSACEEVSQDFLLKN